MRWLISIGTDGLQLCWGLRFFHAEDSSLFFLSDVFLMPFGRSLDINSGGGIFCVLFKTLTERGWLLITLHGDESKIRIYMERLRYFSFWDWRACIVQYYIIKRKTVAPCHVARSNRFLYTQLKSIAIKSTLFSVCGTEKVSVPFSSEVTWKVFFFGLEASMSAAVSSLVGSSVKLPSRYAL